MFDRILERRDQALILGEVIGLMSQIVAERGNFSSRFILNHNSVTGGPGIAPCAAIAVSDQVMLGSLGVR